MFPKLSFKKKSTISKKDKKEITNIVDSQLENYVTKKEFINYYKEIEKDEQKRRIWDGLSTHKKLALLRYLAERKKHEK